MTKIKKAGLLCFNLLLVLLTVTHFASCVTERQRAKICNTCTVQSISKDSIVYRLKDTTIYITQQGPVMYMENPCKLLCDSLGNLKPYHHSERKNGIKTTVKTTTNTLVVTCEADSLKAIIKDLREKETYRKTEKSEVKTIPCKNERTRFDGFTFWWFIISLFPLSIYLYNVIKIYRS